jgi:hypothetical protein
MLFYQKKNMIIFHQNIKFTVLFSLKKTLIKQIVLKEKKSLIKQVLNYRMIDHVMLMKPNPSFHLLYTITSVKQEMLSLLHDLLTLALLLL